jgi:hypothetical protein
MVCSVASFVELQSTGPLCFVTWGYSCCSLWLLPISNRVSFNCYLELVLILILILWDEIPCAGGKKFNLLADSDASSLMHIIGSALNGKL